ncbi:TRAP-type C4-dicarboxylate transport system substrate-binding protein [Neobacillus niacini]|jgi:TRAP-type transport system periplasmic protein|uniref:TRAP transporter substrate-binding protein n=1 Tax=Neobacillus niacini TaxID=86668 RepID=UPI00277DAFD9|nr:TRAP transporter substrate-binding protein DctP [Neobacillus niacini]MDQ1002907.1 TRAP-type C4-dicarboxylate transport system substrate-binding protein [Neobacillus niacini]
MKKMISLLFILVVFMAGCSANQTNGSKADRNGNSSNNKEVIELGFSSWYPTNDPLVKQVFGKWEDLVSEKTDGRVKIVSYHANQLGTADTMLQDLAGGVFEIATISPILFDDTEMFPYTISNLAFALPDSETGTKVMAKFLEKYNTSKQIEILATGNADPYVIWSTSPIESVEDLKGKKIRAISDVHVELVKSWGASPVAIPVADLYESLQKGTLDGAVFSMVGGEAWKFGEVAPFITNIAVSTPTFMPSMNKEAFNSLPEDLQKMFKEELGPALAQLWSDHYQEYTAKAIDNLDKNPKGGVITLSEEKLKPFQKDSKNIWDTWVKDANAKGYDGEAMMNDFKDILKEEGVKLPF